MSDKLKSLILLSFLMFLPQTAFAEVHWYVSVYGEHQKLIEGASETPDVTIGKFLNKSFRGKKIYVKVQEHYELDEFRVVGGASGSGSVGSVSAAAVAGQTQEKTKPMTKFGPLVDSGLGFAKDGDFHSWDCSHLFVTPLGGRKYELLCDKDMVYQ